VFDKKSVKAKRIILDSIKDYIMPHVTGKKYAFEMWGSLTKLYQSINQNTKMVLKEKLKNTRMSKTNTITSYPTKLTRIRDDLAAVREIIDSEELVK